LKKHDLSDIEIYRDEHLLIINKPAGVSTLEDRNDHLSIIDWARKITPEASPCHRLDKETSGVLAIALHSEAYRYFSGLLERREVKKIYHAVVTGLHDFDNLEADQPLYISSSRARVDADGKASLTLIQTLEVFKRHSFIKAFPVTGRMHQIRAHLAFHGAPIVGDTLYGGEDAYLSQLKRHFNLKKGQQERPMIQRVALHAHALTFRHPESGAILNIEAPYPKDFGVLLKQLRKFR
jgi:23S rRNA pseudouridine955/2504/2580 synthase